jgi:hypothetical protein
MLNEGRDSHSRSQQIAMINAGTGEFEEHVWSTVKNGSMPSLFDVIPPC